MSRLLDFDWAVHDIISSSMCDDHSGFVSSILPALGGGSEFDNNFNDNNETANSGNTDSKSARRDNNNNAAAAAAAASSSSNKKSNSNSNNKTTTTTSAEIKSLREPLSRVLRLELLVNETVVVGGEQQQRVRPQLLELSAKEVDSLIQTLQQTLDDGTVVAEEE